MKTDLGVKIHNGMFVNFYGKPKKISGGRITTLAGLDIWGKPGDSMLEILGIHKPIIDPFYTTMGYLLEPLLIQKCSERFGIEIKPINAKECNYDYFPNVANFSGIPDGVAETDKILIECKTTDIKNYDEWVVSGNIPLKYIIQAGSYAGMLKYNKIIFPIAFLTDAENEQIRNDPKQYDPTNTKIEFIEVDFNEELKTKVRDAMRKALANFNHFKSTLFIPKETISPKIWATLK